MGDRGNIIVKDGESKVFLYTHWTGYRLFKDVAKSLARAKSRWDDGPYLARVLFQDMIGDDRDISGYGISSVEGDGGTDITVDLDDSMVKWGGQEIPFADYAEGREFSP